MNIAIIGSSRGIGRAATIEMARDGHNLLLVGRTKSELERLREELPGNAQIFVADITDEDDTWKLATYIESQFPIDGIVLNAAAFPDPETSRSVLKPSAEELHRMIDANVIAHYRLVQKIFAILRKSENGKIVIIGSTSGVRRDNGGIYGISKWALRSFAYNLRDEAKEYGIGVSLINPGGTFTETRKKSSDDDTRLLESKDLGILIAAVFRLSSQAVIEQLDVRPILGDTY